MKKTILITGSTDGLGLATAQALSKQHQVLIHGRNGEKLAQLEKKLQCKGFVADLSDLKQVKRLAAEVKASVEKVDVLINNAGVFTVNKPQLPSGLDVRFVVNVLAPYVLTKELEPLLRAAPDHGRVINLSSAAQAPVDFDAFSGKKPMRDDSMAYAQSKLALTMWSAHMAQVWGKEGPVVLAVNPGSFLGTKMVKEAYGAQGKSISIGSDILSKAALSDEFDARKTGRYFDNDSGSFRRPHGDVFDQGKVFKLMQAMDSLLEDK